MTDESFAALAASAQTLANHQFASSDLLIKALTHSSIADSRVASNERLEFLGDAILGAVVCEMLYRRFPDLLEGDLTAIKSVVVSRQTCCRISQSLGLEEFLIMGKGMAIQETLPQSLLANRFESLLAAIYLDGGDAPARDFLQRHLTEEIELAASGETGENYKSQLQQLVQRNQGITPTYHLLDERGPDHEKSFKITAEVSSRRFPPAWGSNKKEAEQRAACNALCELDGEPIAFPAEA